MSGVIAVAQVGGKVKLQMGAPQWSQTKGWQIRRTSKAVFRLKWAVAIQKSCSDRSICSAQFTFQDRLEPQKATSV